MKSPIFFDAQWASLEVGSPLLNALTSLSPPAQKAINLRFWENYTIEEIANVLRISWDNADQLIESSLIELRERLSGIGCFSETKKAS